MEGLFICKDCGSGFRTAEEFNDHFSRAPGEEGEPTLTITGCIAIAAEGRRAQRAEA